ncbi:MAG: hypothetical protein U9R15_16770, partial [Chloroflexota bacterium]|nr:hypothetical protein [Chloroflexota bacterium]
QEIPIATTIPFNEDVSVPIHTTIPISTTVVIPINAGLLGAFSIDVPIRAVIPVDLEFTVPVSQTVDIATTVPLAMDVPINIPLAETSLIDYIDEVDAALARFEETLARLEGKLINPFSSDEE